MAEPGSDESVFKARIEGEAPDRCWLRTGDLGLVDESGELFIAGRIKDLIIIRGINHYPQDIEATVQECHPVLRVHCGAAFGVLDDKGEEQLVVVQEVERTYRQQIDSEAIIASIREAIAREHDLAARDIVLIRTGTLPQTTSGKIQRNLLGRCTWPALSRYCHSAAAIAGAGGGAARPIGHRIVSSTFSGEPGISGGHGAYGQCLLPASGSAGRNWRRAAFARVQPAQ